jgi:ShK domain-like
VFALYRHTVGIIIISHGIWTSNKGGWEVNAAYVIHFCPLACNVCDIHLDQRDITLGLGLPQSAPGMEDDRDMFNHIRAKVAEIRQYVHSLAGEAEDVREACKMSHPNCARMALATDCEDHADHDIIKYACAAACGTCDDLIYNGGAAIAKAMWEKAFDEFTAGHGKDVSTQ